jgi:hypothetical protein
MPTRSPLISHARPAVRVPGEDLVVDFERQAASGAAQPRVIRHALERLSAQRHSRPRSLSMPSK